MKIFKFICYFVAIWSFCSVSAIGSSFVDDVDIKLDAKTYREIGDRMSEYMNYSIVPCDDFYKFACGNWHTVYPANGSLKQITVMDSLDNSSSLILKKLLQEPGTISYIRNDVKVKHFYKSCVKTSLSYDRGIKSILEFLKIEGGMPELTHGWNATKFNWQQVIIKLKATYDFDILMGAEIAVDVENYKLNKFYVGEMKLSELPKHYYFNIYNSDKLSQYQNKIVKNLRKLGIEHDRAKRLSREFVDIEREILGNSHNQNPNNMLIPSSLTDLQDRFPGFNWSNFLSGLLQYSVSPNQFIIIKNTEYINSVIQVAKKLQPRRLANYIMWKAAQNFMENSMDNYKNHDDYCVAITKKYFPKIISHMLTEKYKYIVKSAEITIDEIYRSIQIAFPNIIERNTWIRDDIKYKLRRQVQTIKVKLLKTHSNLDHSDLNALEIRENDYFNNLLTMMRLNSKIWRYKMHARADVVDMNPLDIDAYYVPNEKIIYIPMPTILYPFFHVNYPKSMNFAKIGVLIAKALMTSIDASNQNVDSTMWQDSDLNDIFGHVIFFGCLLETF